MVLLSETAGCKHAFPFARIVWSRLNCVSIYIYIYRLNVFPRFTEYEYLKSDQSSAFTTQTPSQILITTKFVIFSIALDNHIEYIHTNSHSILSIFNILTYTTTQHSSPKNLKLVSRKLSRSFSRLLIAFSVNINFREGIGTNGEANDRG